MTVQFVLLMLKSKGVKNPELLNLGKCCDIYWYLFMCRFVLGLVEGPFLPGVFFLMSCWYKRSELPPRIALLYGANMLASAFGGLIAAGIVARMQDKMGRPAWVSWISILTRCPNNWCFFRIGMAVHHWRLHDYCNRIVGHSIHPRLSGTY